MRSNAARTPSGITAAGAAPIAIVRCRAVDARPGQAQQVVQAGSAPHEERDEDEVARRGDRPVGMVEVPDAGRDQRYELGGRWPVFAHGVRAAPVDAGHRVRGERALLAHDRGDVAHRLDVLDPRALRHAGEHGLDARPGRRGGRQAVGVRVRQPAQGAARGAPPGDRMPLERHEGGVDDRVPAHHSGRAAPDGVRSAHRAPTASGSVSSTTRSPGDSWRF